MPARKPRTLPAQDPTRERLTGLAEDCVRLTVQGIGGFPRTNNGETLRQMVRELRVMYAEIETPTAGKGAGSGKSKGAARVVDDYEDVEEGDF